MNLKDFIQAGRPVAYSYRSLSDTEKRYAQIEKEMLSIVHAAAKFLAIYLEKKIPSTTTTNHWKWSSKKTVSISTNEAAENAAEAQWYNLIVYYRRGKDKTVAGALSREYLP